ncbi:terminal uridylyltransferase 4-like [Centruroides sculpturatus]|uniref:terminal uridylyltransferase 4-like n=1 Tax=Centruroides sculpturatus TaxID=218467 RepID=UPI000C6E4A74|nr:terminal uridylyltransferase 4-like [Centruroides sculpturatus]
MGSPMSSVLCELVLRNLENSIIPSLQQDILIYARYVDDVFILWKDNRNIKHFVDRINSNPYGLTLELEQQGSNSVNFLDLTITCIKGEIRTNIYCKPTSIPIIIPKNSADPEHIKMAVFRSWIRRAHTHCTNVCDTVKELQYIRSTAAQHGYGRRRIEALIKKDNNLIRRQKQNHQKERIVIDYIPFLKPIIKRVSKKLSFSAECEIHLFGSSVNGFGLKDSNLNIDLAVPQGISPSRVLLNTYDIIKEREDKYINVWKDFTAAVPKITFLDRQTNLTCEITLNNEFSGKTSRLFAHYAYCDERVRKLGIIFRFWAKVCEIDQQQICSLPSYCYPLMVIFFLQQHDPPVIPVLHELTDFDGDDSGNVFQKTSWKSINNQSVAQLWMELLKFYGTKFLFKHHVISVCQLKPLLCTEKKWTTRMMCIEDPYHKKRNVARSIANHQWFHYIVECIRSTYEYFITCRSPSDQSLIENEVFEDDEDEDDEDDDEDIDFVSSDDICEKFEEEQDSALNTDTVKTILSRLNLGNNAEDALKYRIPGSSDLHDNSNLQTLNTSENNQSTFLYKFDVSNFITLKKPTLYCRQCQKTGHYKQNCTIDENLPELRPLPKMDEQHKLLLTEICEVIFNLWKLSPKVQEENKTLLYSLQKHIQCRFLDAKLELFGSSCNGFGFIDSDLDICLTFENNSGEALNQQHIIESLTAELKKYKKIQDILPIPTAKVPIIKFSFKHTNKEGDISVYNTLGQHNTRLLLTYSKIDPRVQKLGYVLKFFAKICDICDASRGSLSSYAYILMVLYFLQQRDPPVIPVLQELYDTSKPKPVRNVDGCNTWFFEDIHNLEDVWPQSKKNTETLGELWLGLLRFYTEKFRVNELVICIRQKAPLTRFEKLWNTKSIAIEDPFDHNHNLGAGVSRKMNAFIFAAFRRGREHFGRTPPNRRDLPNILDYFFNGKLFTDGKNPPNERGCRICNKIGHKMKDCPLKRTDKFRHKQFFGSKRKTNSENQGQKSQEKNFSYNERNMNKSIHKDAHWNNTTNTNFQQSRGFSQNSAIGGNIPQNFQQFKPTNVRQDTRIVSRFQQRDFNK